MPRIGTRREQHEANQLLAQHGLYRAKDVKRWWKKHADSPESNRVVDAAITAFPDALVELQKLGRQN